MNPSITEALNKLFNEQVDCDIIFCVKDEDIQAHKFVMNLRSDVLKTMINNKLSYENGKIAIKDPDVSAEDFRQFLQYLYTDDCKISEKNVKTLLHLGHMYLVQSLMEKCINFIRLNFANVFEYAEIGLLYADDCSLLQKCLKYISESRILENENSLFDGKASAELVKKIAENCERSISLTEDHIFIAIFKWTEYECFVKEVETNPTNRKAAINHVLPFIKFENLKPLTLASTVFDNQLIPEARIFEYLRKNVISEASPEITKPKSNKKGKKEKQQQQLLDTWDPDEIKVFRLSSYDDWNSHSNFDVQGW